MSPPWMPLYIADYRADTAHLSAAEHGAYLNLIMHYWSTGGLPDDDRQLARVACMALAEWRRARPIVQAFFRDGWRHKRIDKELAHAADVISKRRSAAAQRGKKRSTDDESNGGANAAPNDDHLKTQPPSPSPRKKDNAPDGASTTVRLYAFEHGVIRLTEKDFSKWKEAFSYIDLAAELIALEPWAAEQPKWFHAVSGALAKKNREMKHRSDVARAGGPELPLTPSGNKWPEGIV